MNITHEIADVVGKMRHFSVDGVTLETLYINFPAYQRLLEYLKQHGSFPIVCSDYIQWDATLKIRMTNSFENNYGYNKPYEDYSQT